MVDPVAIWGAVTGTAGLGLAVEQRLAARRKRLAVAPGVYYAVSRTEPIRLRDACALVSAHNHGAVPLAVEYIGFDWFTQIDTMPDGSPTPEDRRVLIERRGEIHLEEPVVVRPDGPPLKVYTPLGPLLHILAPTDDVLPFAFTTGQREWHGAPQPLVPYPLPQLGPEGMRLGFSRLKAAAQPPPEALPGLFSLTSVAPSLPDEDEIVLPGS